VNIAWHRKMYMNGCTDLNMGTQLFKTKNDQAGLRHHKQMTTVPKRMHQLQKTDRLLQVRSITVGISYGSAFAIVHYHLGCYKVCARQLMDEHKQTWRFLAELQPRRGPVATTCHRWSKVGTPCSKQGMEWVRPASPKTKKIQIPGLCR
jgi:hypothetical protein